jgi:hypothetical protein
MHRDFALCIRGSEPTRQNALPKRHRWACPESVGLDAFVTEVENTDSDVQYFFVRSGQPDVVCAIRCERSVPMTGARPEDSLR